MIHNTRIQRSILALLIVGLALVLLFIWLPNRPLPPSPAVDVSYSYAAPTVGIVIDQQLRIIQVEPNSRGAQAGLLPGDQVVAIYGKEVSSIAEVRAQIAYMRGDLSSMPTYRPTVESAPDVGTHNGPTPIPAATPQEQIDERDPSYPTRIALAQQAAREISFIIERAGSRLAVTVPLELRVTQHESQPAVSALPATVTPVPADMLYL